LIVIQCGLRGLITDCVMDYPGSSGARETG
jgi:hypothetical protein